MYWIPIIVLGVLAVVAVGWSPLFALILVVPLLIGFLVYAGLRPRADEKSEPPTGSAGKHEDETPTGAWGEERS